ncbi:endonuclease/exonuclease/phosphatase family protein [Modestobacter sp. VKM Ac-2985]|uniref:endonuclease/exonuclease/phosphatase family protein n=1 Tax=Modestobacter sp. VKM Ac-2985 TaxID=3004139 RepID=UPI0022ABAD47|nr:endonuclease/exonuclease/phosphatase family protein [Modestobacter sp. VKM Ac-2985]MCZ2838885.1 endonuclease/exonuclease/phosphatase family protein [Modestobacter sp. VKM Ac-2985]
MHVETGTLVVVNISVPGPNPVSRAVRLVTFNTHHGVGGDGRHDLARLAQVLQAADADVICLQEVDRHFGDRSEHADQALLLSRALGMELAWGPSIDEPGRGSERRQYGNAVLSRLPLLGSDLHRLPGRGEPRTALRTGVELAGGVLWVTTTHLSSRSADDRAGQAAAVAELHADPRAAAVLVGDLNADATAPELAPLRAHLRDAWETAADRSDQAWRFSLHARQGLTHPARRPRMRIDQVWVSAGVTVTGARVLDGAGASDHHPLLVDLEVSTAPAA